MAVAVVTISSSGDPRMLKFARRKAGETLDASTRSPLHSNGDVILKLRSPALQRSRRRERAGQSDSELGPVNFNAESRRFLEVLLKEWPGEFAKRVVSTKVVVNGGLEHESAVRKEVSEVQQGWKQRCSKLD